MLTRYTPLKRTGSLKRTPFKRKQQQTRTVVRGEREICTGQAWEDRRALIYARAGGLCECKRCRRLKRPLPAPLHAVKDEYGNVVLRAGEAHHLKKRKMGGGFRDDRPENLQWLNWQCHEEAERPRKVVPRKPRKPGSPE